MLEATQARPRVAQPRNSPLLLPVLLIGQFMCIVDAFVVNVAMPSIGAGLHASGASLQLIVGGYAIAYAMLLITAARLGDRYGRRRMYLTGVVAFTVASAACALAPDSQALVAFRFAQGAGAALLVPQIFSIIQARFSGQARARALSAYAAVLSMGAVAGLVLGGVIVTANLPGPVISGSAWRPVFGVNVPFGILLAVAVPRALPADVPAGTSAGARGLDLRGLALAAASVLLIVVPLVLGRDAGWPVWICCLPAAGILAGAAFVLVERRELARGGSPLLNLGVLRVPALPAGLAALSGSQAAYGGLLFTFTLFLQAGLGLSPLRAGLAYLPMSVTFGLVSFCWRRLPPAVSRGLPVAGLAVCAASFLAIAQTAGSAREQQLPWLTVVATAGVGLGLGLCVSPLLTRNLSRVPASLAADASGLTTTVVQLSQLAGVAAVGSVYFATGHAMSVTACWLAAFALAGLGPLLLSPLLPRLRSRRGC